MQGAYRRMIAEWLPDFIAFSCNYLANVPEIVDLAVATKINFARFYL
jgi:hopanoid C-3 methylase